MMIGTYADPTDATLAFYALLLLLLIVALLWIRRMGGKSHEQLEMEQEEHLLGKLKDAPPLTEAEMEALARCTSGARLYSAIKSSKRIQVTRAWRFDPEHIEHTIGEPLAFGVDHNGCGWVTIKKDDGHVTHIMHFIADGVNSHGMEIVEVKFT